MDNNSHVADFINKVRTEGALEEPTNTPPLSDTAPLLTDTPPATGTPATDKKGAFDFAPPQAENPQTSDAPPPPPQTPAGVTEEQAETYGKMYVLTLNFLVSNVCSFMTGNPVSKYEVDKEAKEQVQAGAKEYFKTSNIAVTPGFYMFITTVTVFGMVCFRAFIDYKAKQAEAKQAAAREERLRLEKQAEQIKQQAEQRAAAEKAAALQKSPLKTVFVKQQEQIQAPPQTEDINPLDAFRDIPTTETPQNITPPPAPPKAKKPTSAAQEEGVIKADIEFLPEIAKDRRCFEIDAEGFYLLGERREYYNEKTKGDKYKPSAFVNVLIERYGQTTDTQRVINKLVRQRLDQLKKDLGIDSPPPPPAKKQKSQFQH